MRAVRGATRVDSDEREHVLFRSRELMREFPCTANRLGSKDIVSILFSATQDVRSVARRWPVGSSGCTTSHCSVQEMAVDGAMRASSGSWRTWTSESPDVSLRNVYLHGTETLRAEIRRSPEGES